MAGEVFRGLRERAADTSHASADLTLGNFTAMIDRLARGPIEPPAPLIMPLPRNEHEAEVLRLVLGMSGQAADGR